MGNRPSTGRGPGFERAVLIGGPLDGQELEVHERASSTVIRCGEIFHCYRITGTVAKPERNAEGLKILRHKASASERSVRRFKK